MRIGRLAIARGFAESKLPEEPARLAVVPTVEPPADPAQPAANPSLAAVQGRLDALERLTRLCEAGALTIDEFLIEKAAILGHPRTNLAGPRPEASAPISFQPEKAPPQRGRSLLGRIGWLILPLGLIAGLGLAAITQPDSVAQLWQEALRLFGR